MSSPDSDNEDVDERLNGLDAKIYELVARCEYRAATRLAGEMRRLAKSEQRILAYLRSTFVLMNHLGDLMEQQQARDRAIELISLLESEDRARTIEPILPVSEYDYAVSWMTACAYDNLAKAVAQMNGFNSDGMHQCIGDGILVCRRTGKLECITCFREYATDVYKAADDLDMAVHFARVGIAHKSGPHDRRWLGARDVALLMLLRGETESAAEAVKRAWELAETYHTPQHARLLTSIIQNELDYLLGSEPSDIAGAKVIEPAAGEFPQYELGRDQASAVGACCRGDYPQALALLEKWDRLLTERRNLNEWFNNRLRLIAVHRLAGDERQVKRLSEPLGVKARSARDWLTLRCLERMLDPATPPAPVPLVGELRSGLFAVSSNPNKQLPPMAAPQEAAPEERARAPEKRPAPPPLIHQLWSRLGQAYNTDESQRPQAIDAILTDILAIDPASVTSDDEASWLLHMLQQVIGDQSRAPAIWQWAQLLAEPRMQHATTLSLLATLGASLRFGPNEEMTKQIDTERLDAMFRASLDIDTNSPRNFSRAGSYFLYMENLGEAERCFARGSRLDRADSNLALGLAEVYRRTDRTRDALAVLDMSVRAGCKDPKALWRTLLTAFQLEQYEATLAYIDAYEAIAPDQPWTNYYRALSLLELDRAAEALSASATLRRLNPECPFAALALEASSLGALNQTDEFRKRLMEVLGTPLRDVDYLSSQGLYHLLRRIWLSAGCLSSDDSLRIQLEDHLLATGLAPNDYFDFTRKSEAVVAGITFYDVCVQQPLDERWANSPACRAGEQDWQSYVVRWGVLVADEDEAKRLVLSWQSRCYSLPAEVIKIIPGREGYKDAPGIVWQGSRESATDGE